MTRKPTRRAFLTRSALIGCCAAASPVLTPLSFAAAPWDTRLVVIILRGGMDGLDVVQPWGAPEFAGLRGKADGPDEGAYDLDGFFALHPGLAPLIPLWAKGDLGFVHAVATPYRDKRSHFDGQDLLEAGTPSLAGVRDGWLNRMLQNLPGIEGKTAFAIGNGEMKLLDGPAPVADWSPDANLEMTPQAVRLAEMVMQDDLAFHAALSEALMLSGDRRVLNASGPGKMAVPRRKRGQAHLKNAEFAARQLRGDARIASFSINGWDTHNRQDRALKGALTRLSDTILSLQQRLEGEIWQKTAIVAMTEFGRTARENGSGGTDHGTGGAMVMAGGALNGGQVFGRWPGLGELDLYQNRDLAPTDDVRRYLGWALRDLFGMEASALGASVFPGVDMGDNVGIIA